MRVAAGVEYDGTDFKGFQYQDGQRTIQHSLEQAAARVADHDVRVVAAGRTDAGVHATGQVVHFDTDSKRTPYQWFRGVNTHLPHDVSLLWACHVPGEFHARFSAAKRGYRYIILNRSEPTALYHARACLDHRKLDVPAMRAASAPLLGEHDFSSFRAAGCQAARPVRYLYRLTIGQFANWVWFDMVADAFLQHMVRNIVGTLTAVGAGERPVCWVKEVLEARDRTRGGVTASPAGLYLTSISYPENFNLPNGSTTVRYW